LKAVYSQIKSVFVLSDSIVIIPTYNEKENIENIIRKVFSLLDVFHILVVDDGSPDGTAEIVKSLQEEYEGMIHIEERSGKLGLGTAYIHGFKWALARNYDYIFEMDADFSHNPEDLIRLKTACIEGADLAIGSRYISRGKCSELANEQSIDVLFCICVCEVLLQESISRMQPQDLNATGVWYLQQFHLIRSGSLVMLFRLK